MVKPCSRCTVPLVDQETGEVPSKEPIKTMQAFRWEAPEHGGFYLVSPSIHLTRRL